MLRNLSFPMRSCRADDSSATQRATLDNTGSEVPSNVDAES